MRKPVWGLGEELDAEYKHWFSTLGEMQGEIMQNLDLVGERTKLILEEQERDLLRAFRARLFDKQMELAHLKRKKDESAASWIARSRKLEAEVDWAREMGGRLQRVNTDLARENAELVAKTKEGEIEREKSIRDLVALKKDTQHLKLEHERVNHELAEWRARAAFLRGPADAT